MAYVKTNWQTGDVITAAKLNNMETGIYDATEAAADAFVADIDDPQNGDVIKYDSTAGKWVNGEGGGNSGNIIPIVSAADYSSTFTCNYTFAQLLELFDANRISMIKVIVDTTASEYAFYLPLGEININNGNISSISFMAATGSSSGVTTTMITISSTGITYTESTYPTT